MHTHSVGRITRIPDVSTHTAIAIDLSLVTPDLAVNCSWSTEEDCLGSDHLPIQLNEKQMCLRAGE